MSAQRVGYDPCSDTVFDAFLRLLERMERDVPPSDA